MGLRKNQKNLTTGEQKAFVDAVLALKTQPSALHPNNSKFSRYDDFVEVHLNAMAAMDNGQNWGHMAAAFGPWHRVLLLQFERELQKIDPSVTIPYWDWTDTDSGPLWTKDFLGGDGDATGKVTTGKFAGAAGHWPIVVKDDPAHADFLRRAHGQGVSSLPTSATQNQVMNLSTYDRPPWDDMLRDPDKPSEWRAFRPHLEIRLHNLVHNWVGGNMMDMTSPNDPVFWLHHCNIDRLWADWQRADPTHAYLPTTGGPAGHNLNDTMIFHAPGDPAPWAGDFTPASVLDNKALLISYDTDPKPVVVPPAAMHALRARRREMRLPRFVLPDQIAAFGTTD